ncbi:MAG: hypothetical protein ACI4CS_03940 [Candidatus Weimeria sp.]
MFGFKNWVKISDYKDKDEVYKAADLLKNAGLETKVWASEPMPVGGCGAQMRPADWSGKRNKVKAKIDIVYHLAVSKDMEEKARELLNLE